MRWPISRSTSSGKARSCWTLAGEVEGAGRDADALAYLREAIDYRNVLLVELPRGDFAFTIMRQFLFSVAALLPDSRR